jgi:hypothetical protein
MHTLLTEIFTSNKIIYSKPVVAETALAPFAAEAALPLLAAGIVLLLVLQVAGAAVEMKDAVVTENLAV